jgi:hypothetical protein
MYRQNESSGHFLIYQPQFRLERYLPRTQTQENNGMVNPLWVQADNYDERTCSSKHGPQKQ